MRRQINILFLALSQKNWNKGARQLSHNKRWLIKKYKWGAEQFFPAQPREFWHCWNPTFNFNAYAVYCTAAHICETPALLCAELIWNIFCELLIRVGSSHRNNKIFRGGPASNHMTNLKKLNNFVGRGSVWLARNVTKIDEMEHRRGEVVQRKLKFCVEHTLAGAVTICTVFEPPRRTWKWLICTQYIYMHSLMERFLNFSFGINWTSVFVQVYIELRKMN